MTTITPLYPEGKIKTVTFSYDDGIRDDIRLVEIFNRFGMKATFNLISSRLENETHVHADEIPRVYAGHEIASHSANHPFLDRIPKACALNDLLEDRRILEKVTGSIINGFALPFGTYSRETLELVRAAGYLYCRTVHSTQNFNWPNDFLEWNPTCHHRDAEKLCSTFLNCNYAVMPLFYIWGHSYEFSNNNNWDLIEHVCHELSGKEDIWYADNGEQSYAAGEEEYRVFYLL